MRITLREALVALVTALVVGGLVLISERTAGQPAPSSPNSQIPRTAAGKPDFSGVWQANNGAHWELTTHAARPMVALRPLLISALAVTLAGCAGSTERPGFGDETQAPAGNEPETPAPAATGDFGNEPTPPAPEPPEVHEVYGHSATTLYKLEPATKAVTVVGDFKQCESIIDIALDEKSTLYIYEAEIR